LFERVTHPCYSIVIKIINFEQAFDE